MVHALKVINETNFDIRATNNVTKLRLKLMEDYKEIMIHCNGHFKTNAHSPLTELFHCQIK